jgi:DNA-damage-inducible protein D
MDRGLIIRLNKTFEDAACDESGVEYWMARDLQVLLEYDEWRNFSKVIDKAKVSCQTAGQSLSHHFVGVNKTIPMWEPEEENRQDAGRQGG